jgi:NAD-dependent deacetylase
MNEADVLGELLAAAGQGGTVVFTGAGVSTESGIPDFRGPSGLWTQNAPIGFRDYLRDPAMRREAWRRGLNTYASIVAAEPNAAHAAIAEWWHAGLVTAVVTQNIDGLHQRAGLPDSAVIELHGNAHWVACLSCHARFDRPSIHQRIGAGELEPACSRCGGMLKSTTISFGQPLPTEAIRRAQQVHRAARLCLVVGSSLVVTPAASLPGETLAGGGQVAIVNHTPTHLDDEAVFVSRTSAAVLLGAVREVLTRAPRR